MLPEDTMSIEVSIQKYTDVEILVPWASEEEESFLCIELDKAANFIGKLVCKYIFIIF